MKAQVLLKANSPMILEEVGLQDPLTNEVKVRMVAATVCHTDLAFVQGLHHQPAPPMVLGHEGAGIVEKVGPGVTNLKAGDKIVLSTAGSCGMCDFCWTGRPSMCPVASAKRHEGTLLDGTRRLKRQNGTELNHFMLLSCFAEYVVVPVRSAIKVPQQVPLEKVCMYACGASTGVGAVFNVAKVKAGSNVAIWGCGGLGLCALLAAKLAGAGKIICVDILKDKLSFARELGVDYTVDASKEDPVTRIKQLTGGGADYCLEFAGNVKVISQAVEAAKPGGITVVSGAPPAGDKITLDWPHFLGGKVLTGAHLGAMVPAVDIPNWVELTMQGKLPIERLITRTLPLDSLNQAMEYLATGEVGRTLITY
ncbi:MAG: alcohol dehydrogenase catalytic domain-containing protein [Dehalococcoidia bacterium]|jgi:Zn-dependent alcohol dehydrogenase